MREVALEAVKVDENVAMWTNLCRTTVTLNYISEICFLSFRYVVLLTYNKVDHGTSQEGSFKGMVGYFVILTKKTTVCNVHAKRFCRKVMDP